jgi:hypothetical protein
MNRGFAAANQYDLFYYLTPHAPANMPVTFTQLMDTWTVQAGYPLVTVTRNYVDQTATITQVIINVLDEFKIFYGKPNCCKTLFFDFIT